MKNYRYGCRKCGADPSPEALLYEFIGYAQGHFRLCANCLRNVVAIFLNNFGIAAEETLRAFLIEV